MEFDAIDVFVLAGSVGGLYTVLTLPPAESSPPWSSQPLALRVFVVAALIGAAAIAVYLAAVGRWLLCGIYVGSSLLCVLVNWRRHREVRDRAR